jgi:hypothetical protein
MIALRSRKSRLRNAEVANGYRFVLRMLQKSSNVTQVIPVLYGA